MFQTDIHTIFLILALNKFLLGLLLFHIKTITKGKVNGVDYWAYGSILTGLGLLLSAFFRNDASVNTQLVFSLGLNVCILSGDILFLYGVYRFKGKKPNRLLWLLPLLSVVNIFVFVAIHYNVSARFLINAVFPLILYTVTAFEFVRPFRKEYRSSFLFAAWLYIFYGCIHLVRIVIFSMYPTTVSIPENPVSTLLVLMAGLSMVLLTYVLIVIITRTLTFQLNEQIVSRDKLHAIISHDLRGPVGTLLNYTEIMRSSINEWSQEQKDKWLRQMESAASGSRFLLENLFHWSRSQLNEIKVNAAENDLAEIIRQVITQMKGQAENKNIEIRFTNSVPVYAHFDQDMMGIVLRNLISNAVKFTPDGGKIIVSLAESVNHIEIIVSDTGTGMTEEKLKLVFKNDHFGSTPGTKNEKGSGFGLLLCRDFVKLNNGQISAESEAGKGSVFRIQLPKNNMQNE